MIDAEGIVRYRGAGVDLTQITSVINTLITTSLDEPNQVERSYYLNQNFPNPFNPTTAISFGLNEKQRVHLEIFDIMGRLIRKLLDADMQPGEHEISWDGRNQSGNNVAAGIYFYHIRAGAYSDSKKMVLMR